MNRNDKRLKITEETIKNILINNCGWTEEVDFKVYKYYRSPCKRYVLQESEYSNLSDPHTGKGWNLHIDNSDMNSIGNVSVNYVEEVVQIIDIFEKY